MASKYDKYLEELPIKTPEIQNFNYSSFHLYVVLLDLDNISRTKKEVFNYLRSKEIGVNLHYIPIPMHPFYRNLGFNYRDYPNSYEYYEKAISIPMFPNLSEQNQLFVVNTLKEILQ